jgi:hypothetical protein
MDYLQYQQEKKPKYDKSKNKLGELLFSQKIMTKDQSAYQQAKDDFTLNNTKQNNSSLPMISMHSKIKSNNYQA